jgi:hypothetical protein
MMEGRIRDFGRTKGKAQARLIDATCSWQPLNTQPAFTPSQYD